MCFTSEPHSWPRLTLFHLSVLFQSQTHQYWRMRGMLWIQGTTPTKGLEPGLQQALQVLWSISWPICDPVLWSISLVLSQSPLKHTNKNLIFTQLLHFPNANKISLSIITFRKRNSYTDESSGQQYSYLLTIIQDKCMAGLLGWIS